MDPTKRSYKVTWPGWKRPDLSNTTWMSEDECMEQFAPAVKKYHRKREKNLLSPPPKEHATSLIRLEEIALDISYNKVKRAGPGRPSGSKATRGTATAVPPPSTRSSKRKRSPEPDSDAPQEAEDEVVEVPRPKKPVSTLSSVSNGRRANVPLFLRQTTTLTPTPPPRDVLRPSRKSARRRTSDETVVNSPTASTSGSRRNATTEATDAKALETKWQNSLPDDVALITLSAEGGAGPRLPPDFEYLESRYRGDDREPDPGFFVPCDCPEDSCGAARSTCICLNDAPCAYDRRGRFTFKVQGLVTECNNACECDAPGCANRVAQLPRDVTLQLFATEACGWGVRPTVRLERGKVIGVCTGEVLKREDAERLKAPMKDYCWDLDFNENGDESDGDQRYSVLSYSCGNWTRFLNHSCQPNVQVYPVIYDNPQVPKLAFVACKLVEPFTELLVDYKDMSGVRAANNSPTVTRTLRPGQSRPKGSQACKCGAAKCRGWY
ncbi:SET domain-containing protein [Auricularia subglabra TFB-10046 SS5]|nr:SET domain-containing protein [Auricularia subglabra TFB-10046 SS5]